MKLPDRFILVPGLFEMLADGAGISAPERHVKQDVGAWTDTARAMGIQRMTVLVLKAPTAATPVSGVEMLKGDDMVEIWFNGRRYVRKED